MEKWRECIKNMRTLVKQWVAARTLPIGSQSSSCSTVDIQEQKFLIPKLCFVEGFLLFTDPNISRETEEAIALHPTRVERQADRLQIPLDAVDYSYERPLSTLCFEKLGDQRAALMDFFDIKLFLPTSKSVAKARRFSRKPYIDPPVGNRIEGQYWKTEGYFENVVWPNYEKSHGWLFNIGKEGASSGPSCAAEYGSDKSSAQFYWKKDDVHIRETDAGVEETLSWAVDVILAEMSK